MSVDAVGALLCWYRVDKRDLPWRSAPGERPDPYRVWLSEIMLQQTTVAAVKPYFAAFTTRWPSVQALAAARDEDVMHAWAGLGYYARARNLLACARVVANEHAGVFPDEEAALRALPGIGDYTAAAIAAIAFGRPSAPVDANIERVMTRLHRFAGPMPGARRKVAAITAALVPAHAPSDFAQALMDLGSRICTPRRPACHACPLGTACAARAAGDQEAYPVKARKMAKPMREGAAYWLEHDGQVLLVRRPPKGLLGGMLGLPELPPVEAGWVQAGAVTHVFTHFTLNMRVFCAATSERAPGLWHDIAGVHAAGLPTLFAKAAAIGRAWREQPPLALQPVGAQL